MKVFIKCPYCKQRMGLEKVPAHRFRCNYKHIARELMRNGIHSAEAWNIAEKIRVHWLEEKRIFNKAIKEGGQAFVAMF